VNPIDRLIQELSRLPGIGEKTATRLAYFILRSKGDYSKRLAVAIQGVTENVYYCDLCQNISEAKRCPLCAKGQRDTTILCVVAEPSDILTVEKTGFFRGLYYVLHGVLSPLKAIGPDQLRLSFLMERLKRDKDIQEIVLALSPNAEGEATALYLTEVLRPFNKRLTRLASGIPVGGDLEYIDPVTLTRALERRFEV